MPAVVVCILLLNLFCLPSYRQTLAVLQQQVMLLLLLFFMRPQVRTKNTKSVYGYLKNVIVILRRLTRQFAHSRSTFRFFSIPFFLLPQVSWVRRKGDELNLITFGRHTYSSDSRYSLEYIVPNDWQLLIQYANERDEGHYECQISSHPPLVLLVYLTVVGKCHSAHYSAHPACPPRCRRHRRFFTLDGVALFCVSRGVPCARQMAFIVTDIVADTLDSC